MRAVIVDDDEPVRTLLDILLKDALNDETMPDKKVQDKVLIRCEEKNMLLFWTMDEGWNVDHPMTG